MNNKEKNKTALFVMPRKSSAWKGAEAMWITAGGWAAAAKRLFGEAIIFTNDTSATPKEILSYPVNSSKDKNQKKRSILVRYSPEIIKTLYKDFLLWRASKNGTLYNHKAVIKDQNISLVWEQHDLFPGIGYKLAKKYNVPFILYVHAPQVWETSKWGVKRPIWGKIIEKIEAKSLKRADLVACVSEQVSKKLIEMGVPKEKIHISPMAVDPHLFDDINSNSIKRKFDLNNKLVLGWTGSFRSFHGLDLLIKTFNQVLMAVPNAILLLIGDGKEREEIEKLVENLDISENVIFAGRKSFIDVPKYVNAFDVAIVSARSSKDFHYSPLKLREYLGAGIASLAPNAGEIPKTFKDNLHLRIYEIGEIESTSQIIIELFRDQEKRQNLGKNGKEYILNNGTWDVELDKALKKLNT